MKESKQAVFRVKDCALVAIATGARAYNLMDLRYRLADADPGCIYYHFWGGLLKPRFDTPELGNDFADWVKHELHDGITAERLAVINPSTADSIEDLREEMIDVIEERVYESEVAPWRKAENPFHLLNSQIVVFDTGRRITQPEELVGALSDMSPGSIFYHFIDARRRTPEKEDDFRAWLGGLGSRYTEVCHKLACLDPYFATLPEIKRQITAILSEEMGAKR